MINVDSVIKRPVLGRIKNLWRFYPFGERVGAIDFTEELTDSQISKFEVYSGWLSRIHLISPESGKYVPQVNVLMSTFVYVQKLNSL